MANNSNTSSPRETGFAHCVKPGAGACEYASAPKARRARLCLFHYIDYHAQWGRREGGGRWGWGKGWGGGAGAGGGNGGRVVGG